MVDFQTYAPRMTRVHAVQLSWENFGDLALLTGGQTFSGPITGELKGIAFPGPEGVEQRAAIGDWVLRRPNRGYEAMSREAFITAFALHEGPVEWVKAGLA